MRTIVIVVVVLLVASCVGLNKTDKATKERVKYNKTHERKEGVSR